MKLDLISRNELAHLGTSPRVETITYEHSRMPTGQRAFISRFDGRWKILRTVGQFFSYWYGEFVSPEEARDALEAEVAQYPR